MKIAVVDREKRCAGGGAGFPMTDLEPRSGWRRGGLRSETSLGLGCGGLGDSLTTAETLV